MEAAESTSVNKSLETEGSENARVINSPLNHTDDKLETEITMPPSESPANLYASPTQLPNTDNLLDISVPKVALLGKEQAKKRLYAFSASKLSISPNCKRSKSKGEDKTEVDLGKKQKKGLNPGDKAKAVIEEIEEIKKIEHAYYEAIEQGLLDTKKEWKKHHRKSHRRSRSKDNRRSRSAGREKYPEDWGEVKRRGYDQQKLTDMKSSALKKVDECLDFRKQFLFEAPSRLLHPVAYKDISGKEKFVSTLSRRVTKTKPKISFSVTEKVEYSTVFNRNCVLDYVPKHFKENILKIISSSSRPLETISSKPTTRRWFPKTAFSNVEKETECTVLENSLGLSFLQNYSDEEEQEKDDGTWTEKCIGKKSNKEKEISRRKKLKEEKRRQKKRHKTKKSKTKKEKTEKPKQGKAQKERREETAPLEAPDAKVPKNLIEDSKSKKKKDKEAQKNNIRKGVEEVESVQIKKSRRVEVADTKSKRKHSRSSPKVDKAVRERSVKNEKGSTIVPEKCETQSDAKSPIQHSKNQNSASEETKTVEVIKSDKKRTTEQELDTPDTDEYYSNWESEDELLNSSASKQSDLYTETSGVNVSWESDADIPLSKSPVRQFYQSETPRKEVTDFSPFRDRFINERRRSRCSMDNPSPPFLEMPLNIRTYREVQWPEERNNSERIHFRVQNDQKPYSLYTEDSWEKDDYMTIKSEELRLEEERRTLMEERRQLEIEKRKLEELERERYYFRRSNSGGEERYRHKHYRPHREVELDKGSRRNCSEVASENTGEEQTVQAAPNKRRRSRWQDIDVNELETSQPGAKENWEHLKDVSNTTVGTTEVDTPKPEILENEYEKFMKALGSQTTTKEKVPTEKKNKKVVKKKSKAVKSSSSSSSSSSSDDSDSSSTSSTTSSSSSSCKKKKKTRRKPSVLKKKNTPPPKKVENKQVIKIEDVERDLLKQESKVNVLALEIPLPQLETSSAEQKPIPLPVPSPKMDPFVLNNAPKIPDSILAISPVKIENAPKGKVEKSESPSKKTNNIIPIKFLTPELRKLAHDTSLTNEIGTISTIVSPLECQNDRKTDSPLQNVINDFNLSNKILIKNEEEVTTSDCTEAVSEKANFKDVINIDDLSIPKRDLTKKDSDLVKRNEETPKSEECTPKRSSASKRKRERKDSENVSPVSEINRKLSSNQLNHFAINKCTKTEKENLQRISSVEKCNLPKASPLSSPLDGFKRSVADSTISDEQLLQSNLVECTESPNVYKNVPERSPRRMSLDERINQALGLSEEPKPITTTYSSNCNPLPQYYEECYDDYAEEPKKPQTANKRDQRSVRENSKLKVLQVGNILQVVPTEDYCKIPAVPAPPKKKTPLQQNKISNSTQKILQVGNMLQIVPTTSFPDEVECTPAIVPSTSTPIKSTFNAEMLIKQKAERRAEKDKRKQERQAKRKEKEKKRKERERRKQLKVKLQTEAMIKQALILEDITEEQQLNEPQKPVQWPPIPQIVSNCSYRPPGKGILTQRKEEKEELLDKRKQVQFSDGVRPGEGTSPSGGEELSSPPPAPRKLPKEKRFRKVKPPKKEKVPKKKKVKVKVIRQQSQYDDESEEDTLPPPPPPPGSPPPHVFPARIKEPIFNNIHTNLLASINNPPIQTPDTSYPPPPVYRPNAPVVIPHHIPLHPPGPPPPVHRHHVPPLPNSVVHHGGFNQSTNLISHGNHR